MLIQRSKKRYPFRGFAGRSPTTNEVRQELESLYDYLQKESDGNLDTIESLIETVQQNHAALASQVSELDDGETAANALGDYKVIVNTRLVSIESRLTVVEQRLMPVGGIIMWSGLLSAIPAGWALCDGGGGRPDLREKFVKGAAASIDPGVTGGAATHSHNPGTLGADSAGAHTHGFTSGSNAATPDLLAVDVSAAGVAAAGTTDSNGAHTHSISGATDTASSEPEFYSVAFIIKTA